MSRLTPQTPFSSGDIAGQSDDTGASAWRDDAADPITAQLLFYSSGTGFYAWAQTQPLFGGGLAIPIFTAVTGTMTSMGDTVVDSTLIGDQVLFLEISGTWSGTIDFEYFDGAAWQPLTANDGSTTSTTGNGSFTFIVPSGVTQVRTNLSVATSGTSTAAWNLPAMGSGTSDSTPAFEANDVASIPNGTNVDLTPEIMDATYGLMYSFLAPGGVATSGVSSVTGTAPIEVSPSTGDVVVSVLDATHTASGVVNVAAQQWLGANIKSVDYFGINDDFSTGIVARLRITDASSLGAYVYGSTSLVLDSPSGTMVAFFNTAAGISESYLINQGSGVPGYLAFQLPGSGGATYFSMQGDPASGNSADATGYYFSIQGGSSSVQEAYAIYEMGGTFQRGGTGTGAAGDVFIGGIWLNAGSGSVVTSVALAAISGLTTVSGSPVTGSGTLTQSLATQAANTIFAGPSSGSAASPTFRALTAADVIGTSPGIRASGDLTGQTAGVSSIAAYTTTALGTYRVGGYLNITAVTLDVVQLQCTYTDENSNAQTVILATGSTIVNVPVQDLQIRVKSGAAITIKTVLTTGTGTILYDCGASVEQLR